MREKAKGIIFDLGHTLIDYPGDWDVTEERGKKALLDFLRGKGLDVSEEMVKYFSALRYEGHVKADVDTVEYTAHDALRRTFEKYKLNGKSENLIEEALVYYYRPELETWRPYPDSKKVLKELEARGYRLGLISNAADHRFIMNCLDRFEFREHLDPALSSAGFHVRKPHPEIFEHVAAAWEMVPEKIVMVGDQLYYDVYGAHQVGMQAVWFEQNTDKAHTFIPEKLKDDPKLVPDKTIYSLSELLDWLT